MQIYVPTNFFTDTELSAGGGLSYAMTALLVCKNTSNTRNWHIFRILMWARSTACKMPVSQRISDAELRQRLEVCIIGGQVKEMFRTTTIMCRQSRTQLGEPWSTSWGSWIRSLLRGQESRWGKNQILSKNTDEEWRCFIGVKVILFKRRHILGSTTAVLRTMSSQRPAPPRQWWLTVTKMLVDSWVELLL